MDVASPRVARQRQIAQELWQSYLAAGDFFQFDRWLATEFKKHGRFGKRDRTLYREWLFAALRYGELAAAVMELAAVAHPQPLPPFLEQMLQRQKTAQEVARRWRRLDPRLFFALIEARYRIDHSADRALLPAPDQLDANLQAHFTAIQAAAEQGLLPAQLLWQGIPLTYLPVIEARALQSAWNAPQRGHWLQQQTQRPPVWARINHRGKRQEILSELGERVIHAEGDTLALAVQGSLNNFRCFQEGWLEVQDLASQLLGNAVACQPGELVWDACAGGGGKTLQIAAQLNQKGLVLASDIRGNKLKDLQERVQRAGFRNLRTERWNGEALPPLPKEVTAQQGFDWVLVDAPCSSSGTWRRNPEVKYRELGKDLTELTGLQRKLLLQASQAVKPGGHLVYGTCSFRTEENEAVVASLLEQGGWRLELQSLVGCPQQDADTMFVARLKRED